MTKLPTQTGFLIDLVEPIVVPWAGPEYPISRAWVPWHVLEHELHHGGELTHLPGWLGLVVKLPSPPLEIIRSG
jgi:hypothetical protein